MHCIDATIVEGLHYRLIPVYDFSMHAKHETYAMMLFIIVAEVIMNFQP